MSGSSLEVNIARDLGGDAAARTVAADVLDVLRDWGVRHVFICPGTTEAAFLDASLGQRDVEVVLTTHESVTVAMADGYGRATGEPSVAYLHTNVGLGNGLSHLAAARLARSPVVVLNGLKPAVVQAHGGFTTAPAVRDLVRQYVKHDWQSLSAGSVAEDVTRALRVATAEPTGPTWVGLAQDLMESPGTGVPDAARFRAGPPTRPDPGAVAEAAAVLAAARRPVLVAGSEVARHGAWPQLVELAELLGAPVVNEDRRTLERTGFPTDHPHFAGTYDVTAPAVADCDVAFFVGARCFVEFEPPERPNVPPGARVVHSHVDPEEIGRIYGVDVALVGDERHVLADVLDHLRRHTDPPPPTRAAHLALAREALAAGAPTGDRAAGAAGTAGAVGGDGTGGLRVADVVGVLVEQADAGTSVVSDVTTSTPPLLRDLPQTSPYAYFATCSGSLGWGAGAALGVALGLPGRRVLSVLGDGVFQFGIQALWSAARADLPVTFVVVNNESYAAVGSALHRRGGRAARTGVYPGKDISGPRIDRISEGFGVPAVRVHDTARLREALRAAREQPGPFLVEVMTDPTDLGSPAA